MNHKKENTVNIDLGKDEKELLSIIKEALNHPVVVKKDDSDQSFFSTTDDDFDHPRGGIHWHDYGNGIR